MTATRLAPCPQCQSLYCGAITCRLTGIKHEARKREDAVNLHADMSNFAEWNAMSARKK